MITNEKTILVAEDNDLNYELLKFYLSEPGYPVVRAINGLEALNFCENNPDNIAIIFMDLMMPKMDGIEATCRIKKKYPQIPVIMQTAFSEKENMRKCFEAGCDEFITKPISKKLVRDILERFLLTDN